MNHFFFPHTRIIGLNSYALLFFIISFKIILHLIPFSFPISSPFSVSPSPSLHSSHFTSTSRPCLLVSLVFPASPRPLSIFYVPLVPSAAFVAKLSVILRHQPCVNNPEGLSGGGGGREGWRAAGKVGRRERRWCWMASTHHITRGQNAAVTWRGRWERDVFVEAREKNNKFAS